MTEKDYNPQQRTDKTMKKQQKAKTKIVETPKDNKIDDKKQEIKEHATEEDKVEQKEIPKKQEKKIIKKDFAIVNAISLPISTKKSVAICKFIRGKKIERAIADLEEVSRFKKAIPMRGEIPHRKGRGMMAGRYPIKPVGFFIKMLKNLKANANVNGIEEPVIIEAVPNRASRPYGRFGAVKRKRTHIMIKVMEKKK